MQAHSSAEYDTLYFEGVHADTYIHSQRHCRGGLCLIRACIIIIALRFYYYSFHTKRNRYAAVWMRGL